MTIIPESFLHAFLGFLYGDALVHSSHDRPRDRQDVLLAVECDSPLQISSHSQLLLFTMQGLCQVYGTMDDPTPDDVLEVMTGHLMEWCNVQNALYQENRSTVGVNEHIKACRNVDVLYRNLLYRRLVPRADHMPHDFVNTPTVLAVAPAFAMLDFVLHPGYPGRPEVADFQRIVAVSHRTEDVVLDVTEQVVDFQRAFQHKIVPDYIPPPASALRGGWDMHSNQSRTRYLLTHTNSYAELLEKTWCGHGECALSVPMVSALHRAQYGVPIPDHQLIRIEGLEFYLDQFDEFTCLLVGVATRKLYPQARRKYVF